MLKKLIIIENGEEIQVDTLEELIKTLIDENFYNMTQREKIKKMEMKALANCLNTNMQVTQEIPIDGNIKNKFIIKDEYTYILSLLITNNILLLERKDSSIFTKFMNKDSIKDNYIIVNKFAKELLIRYLK